MADLLSARTLRRILPWLLIVIVALLLPVVLPPFRLNLLGRFLSLGIVALGIDLIWGFTGLLSLGQGIFFALGGYALGMHLQLGSLAPGELPEFFGLYGVKSLPAFWQPFSSPLFTLLCIWVLPALVAGVLGGVVWREFRRGHIQRRARSSREFLRRDRVARDWGVACGLRWRLRIASEI
jgi:urea transport system permease protein